MKTSLKSRILEELLRPQFYYKGVKVNLLGLPTFYGNYSRKSISNSLSELSKNNLISRDKDFIKITPKGKKYWMKKQDSLTIFPGILGNNAKDLLVMFDIPETRKGEREWFRFHLKRFGYQMIQRSVWVGPSPLPKDFTEYLKKIKLEGCIKTFKLAKSYKPN